MRAGGWTACLGVAAVVALAPIARAQGIRVSGMTTAQYIELRPWVDDSIAADSTTGTDNLRLSTRGVVVNCDPGAAFCRYKRSANNPISTLPLIQDLQVSAWGLGQGIQIYAHGRARAAVGQARDVWPRAEDPFDLLAAYVQI